MSRLGVSLEDIARAKVQTDADPEVVKALWAECEPTPRETAFHWAINTGPRTFIYLRDDDGAVWCDGVMVVAPMRERIMAMGLEIAVRRHVRNPWRDIRPRQIAENAAPCSLPAHGQARDRIRR